jgi:hypothetical protein
MYCWQKAALDQAVCKLIHCIAVHMLASLDLGLTYHSEVLQGGFAQQEKGGKHSR